MVNDSNINFRIRSITNKKQYFKITVNIIFFIRGVILTIIHFRSYHYFLAVRNLLSEAPQGSPVHLDPFS